jgi:hypothetical protein
MMRSGTGLEDESYFHRASGENARARISSTIPGLGIGIVLHMLPSTRRELALPFLVGAALVAVRPDPVAEAQHAADLLAACGEDVKVGGDLRCLQQAVGEPVGLADPELEAGCLQRGNVCRIVVRVGDRQHHVDDRLRAESRDRGRADMLEEDHLLAERAVHLPRESGELGGPCRIVRLEHDRSVVRHALAQGDRVAIFLGGSGHDAQRTGSLKPTCQWDPSQNGLFFDAPQRHSV